MIRLFLLAALLLTGCGADDSEQHTEQETCHEIPHYYLTGEQPLTCAELRALMNSGELTNESYSNTLESPST